MNFKNWILNEASKSRGIYFHGTSSYFLKNILSEGLNPNPRKKVWSSDNQASLTSSDRTSFDGIYVTTNLRVARSAANNAVAKFKKNRLYVICELESKSLYADEDYLKVPEILNYNEYNNFLLYKILRYGGSVEEKQFFEITLNKWVDELIKINYFSDSHPELIKRVKELASKQGFYSKLTRNVAYLHDINVWKDLFRGNENIPALPSKSEAELVYREFIDKMTKIKKIRYQSDEDIVSFDDMNGRIIYPVRYSGSNRIICILENVKENDFIKHYGEVPLKFTKEYESSFGELNFL